MCSRNEVLRWSSAKQKGNVQQVSLNRLFYDATLQTGTVLECVRSSYWWRMRTTLTVPQGTTEVEYVLSPPHLKEGVEECYELDSQTLSKLSVGQLKLTKKNANMIAHAMCFRHILHTRYVNSEHQ